MRFSSCFVTTAARDGTAQDGELGFGGVVQQAIWRKQRCDYVKVMPRQLSYDITLSIHWTLRSSLAAETFRIWTYSNTVHAQ